MSKAEISTDVQYQTIEGFGVSAAWWAQVVGGWENTDPKSGKPVRERIAELLFNKENGIGINTYRYNLGGGSKNSGSSVFSNPNRTAESFLMPDGTFNRTRDKNAVYMLNAAVKNGVDFVVLFSNSPPENYTKNHKSCLDKPWRTNLAPGHYADFSRYLLDSAEHFIKAGIPVKYISPVNEPVWVWTESHGQEGCHYRPWGAHALLREVCRQLDNRPELSGVKLSGAENGDIRWFNKTYTRIMLGDSLIRSHSDGVDIHSYFLPLPFPGIFNDRLRFLKRYRKYLDRRFPGQKVKVSEWTHMKGGRDCGMDSALEQARVMLEDLCILGASSWQHWIAVSDVDYCDGLIYINPDQSFEMTKRYYAFGNFTKYVPSGSVRIEAKCFEASVMSAAFKTPDGITLIFVNPDNLKKPIEIQNPCGYKPDFYAVTDGQNNLEEVHTADFSGITLSERSVTTFIFGRDGSAGSN